MTALLRADGVRRPVHGEIETIYADARVRRGARVACLRPGCRRRGALFFYCDCCRHWWGLCLRCATYAFEAYFGRPS